jgi:hypothetical protein
VSAEPAPELEEAEALVRDAFGTVQADPRERSRLRVLDVGEIESRVAASGPASWLLEGLWPADAYGVGGAEDKAGKTWAGLDLGVSVVTGTPWFGYFACPFPGPVLMFLGEGGERAMVRRLSAIVASRGGDFADLDGLRIAFAVPKLTDRRDNEEVRAELEAHPARLVILDPFYLATAGLKGNDLYAMGEALYSVQQLCQEAGSALAIWTHWNKTGEGSGPRRFTGVGPSAWGRVLGSAAVEHRRTELDGTTDVLLRWEFMGAEVPETTFRMRRRVRAEDAGDLDSPLTYSVEVTPAEAGAGPHDGLSPARLRVLAALDGATEAEPLTRREVGDRLADDGQGPPLKVRTIQDALVELSGLGLVDGMTPTRGAPGKWWRTT